MKKFLILTLVSLLGVTFASLLPQTTSGKQAKFRRSEKGVENRYIVVLNENYVDRFAVEPVVRSEAEFLTSQFGGEVKEVYSAALKGFVVEMPEKAAIALSKDDRVAFIEQDALVEPSASQTAGSWGLDRIDQRQLPMDSKYTWGPDGTGVHAYIIDSGIRPTHVEFGGRATADYDALPDGQNGIDCYGHGTHVAGTIGGATYGVAKNVRLHGVRVLPCTGSGMVSYIIRGIDWVTANRVLPAVANISITISAVSTATNAAVQRSIDSGVTYVVSSGNNGLNACDFSPGSTEAAITVGSVSPTDARAGYANYGSCVDIWAPGSSIISASHLDDTSSRSMSGTSMSAPHVAGVAALYLSTNPNASPATVANHIFSTSTQGVMTNMDGASPNRIVYSWLGGNPPATPTPSPTPAGRVRIRKQTSGPAPEGSAAFPYNASNLSSSNFTLQPNSEFVDPNVSTFGNVITVTEAPVLGWQLTSITCNETAGSTNTTIDLANKRANIVVEPGEQVDCTFTSSPLAPSAAYAEISGSVTYPDGRGIKGVTITLTDVSSGKTATAVTNSFGMYKITGMPTTHLYMLTASGGRIRIPENVIMLTLNENYDSANFIAAR